MPITCADAGAVLRIGLRAQNSKIVMKEFGSLLSSIRETVAPRGLQTSLGVDAAKDVDWIQVIWNEGDTDHPLVLAAGDFDPVQFKLDAQRVTSRKQSLRELLSLVRVA